MRKVVIISIVLIISLIGAGTIASAAPQQKPNVWDAITDLQNTIANMETQISELWGNSTAQQSAIQTEVDARVGGDQALGSEDQALWTNATEQQAAIDAIPPASSLHLGERDTSYTKNVVYQADSDGFVVAWGVPRTSTMLLGGCGDDPIFPNPVTDPYNPEWIATVGLYQISGGFMMPVQKGNYWIVATNPSDLSWVVDPCVISWIPLIP